MFLNHNETSSSSNRATAIIEEARAYASKRLAEAQKEVADAVNAAEVRGRDAGFGQGSDLLEKIRVLDRIMTNEMRNDLIKNAVVVARDLLKAELDTFDDSILRITLNVLSTISDAQDVYIRVNPDDAACLIANKEKIIHALERAQDVEIRIDKRVERGGVLVQTEYGLIDAQLSTQLEELARVIGNDDGPNY